MRKSVAVSGGVVLAAVALLLSIPRPAQAWQGWNDPVRCNSQDGRYARCVMPWRDARLLRQESKAACIRGQSWGVDRGVLWVDRGCRGLFVGADRDYGYGDGDRDGDRDRDRDGWRGNSDRWRHRDDGGEYDRDDDRGGWQPGPGWDRDIRLQCDSNGRHYQMCQVDVGRRGWARLVRQLSSANCTEGYSWGWNRAGVWVDHGCRGQFVVERRW